MIYSSATHVQHSFCKCADSLFNNYVDHKPHKLVHTTTVVEAAATKPKQGTDQQVLLGGRPFVAMQVIVHRTLSRPRKNIIKVVS